MKYFLLPLIIFFSGIALIAPPHVIAQTAPRMVMTWRAHNSAPSSYQGRILPTRGTMVDVGLEVVSGSSFVDLSKNTISWLINNELYRSGKGLETFSFEVPASAGSEMIVKAIILSFQGKKIEKSIVIPIVKPEVIIESSYSGDVIPALREATFIAKPFFFNIEKLSDLIFTWGANNELTSGESDNPDTLVLDLSNGVKGNTVSISINAVNRFNQIESAAQSKLFTIQ